MCVTVIAAICFTVALKWRLSDLQSVLFTCLRLLFGCVAANKDVLIVNTADAKRYDALTLTSEHIRFI